MSELAAWLILLIPIASFVLIGLGRLVPALRRHQLWAGYLTILAIGAAVRCQSGRCSASSLMTVPQLVLRTTTG